MNKEHIINITNQICEAWEIESPEIKFLEIEYMKNTLGVAFYKGYRYTNIIIEDNLIIFNEILLHYPFDKILQVIYHELAHLITEKGDDNYEFEMFCKLNNIPLSEEWIEENI